MERISSGCGRREFSCNGVEYQVVVSVQSWCIVTSGRNFYVQAAAVTKRGVLFNPDRTHVEDLTVSD
jgi:hypothetical protein